MCLSISTRDGVELFTARHGQWRHRRLAEQSTILYSENFNGRNETSSVGDTLSCTLSIHVSRSRAERSYQAMDVPLLCLLPSLCLFFHTPQSDGLSGYTLMHEKSTRHCRTRAVKHPCNALPCLRLTTPPSPEPLLTPHAMARMAWETTPPQIG